MRIKCGPRYVRTLRIQHDYTAGSPRAGDAWRRKVGTLVTWDAGVGSIIRELCDVNTDAARCGLQGQAGWLVPWPHMGYRQWYDQLPLRQICGILPVYAYVFGTTVRVDVEPFASNSPGQVGWIYCTHKSTKQRWSMRYGNPSTRKEHAIAAMTDEIMELDCWLRGDVYGYVIMDVPSRPSALGGPVVEASWGHYGANPYTNGMFDTISDRYKHLLEEECHACGISRP